MREGLRPLSIPIIKHPARFIKMQYWNIISKVIDVVLLAVILWHVVALRKELKTK